MNFVAVVVNVFLSTESLIIEVRLRDERWGWQVIEMSNSLSSLVADLFILYRASLIIHLQVDHNLSPPTVRTKKKRKVTHTDHEGIFITT